MAIVLPYLNPDSYCTGEIPGRRRRFYTCRCCRGCVQSMGSFGRFDFILDCFSPRQKRISFIPVQNLDSTLPTLPQGMVSFVLKRYKMFSIFKTFLF